MKKGFTLIELLAVIVILAIISVIAVPIVLGIINDAKAATLVQSGEFYVDAVENKIILQNLKPGEILNPKECVVDNDGNIICDGIFLEIEVYGEKPNSGSIIFDSGKLINANLTFKDKIVSLSSAGNLVLENIPEPKSFNEDSWDTITKNVRIGNLSKYKVGDTKEITLTSEDTDIAGTYTVRISNTSTPAECNTSGFSQTACGFVIEFVDIISQYAMNPKGDYNGVYYEYGWSIGGYPNSSMYTYLQNNIYNSFPRDLKTKIINTYVVSGHEEEKTKNYTSNDKLYLLSTKEVWGEDDTWVTTRSDSVKTETRQLDYYNSVGVSVKNYSSAKKKLNDVVSDWWLRSADSNGDNTFSCVSDRGAGCLTFATYNKGVSIAFRIG